MSLSEIRRHIAETLKGAKNPCALISFGKDSMLLLHLIREVKPDISLVWFRKDLTPEQEKFAKQIIMEWDLTVYGWNPSNRYYVPNGKELTLVNEYAVNDARLPVLVDVEHGDKCGLLISQERTPEMNYGFDMTFTGWKRCDSHPLMPKVNLDNIKYGNTTFISPLKDLTDDEVWNYIRELNVPFDERRYAGGVDSDSLYACTRCLTGEGEVFCPDENKMIPIVQWDKESSLNHFQRRYAA